MKYENITEGRFLDRPNRFIAHVEIAGQTETVHVKNTGRCRELLIPGVQVFLEKSSNPARKTAYDLVCVNKGGRLINMDSQIPNKAALEWVRAGHLFPEEVQVTPETSWPTFGLSSGETSFIPFKIAVSSPFFPRYATRTSFNLSRPSDSSIRTLAFSASS